MASLKLLALAAGLAGQTLALDNGFGRTPVMGFNSYNDVACSPNDQYVRNTISALVQKNLLAAGYKYFQIDCGWQGANRLSNGSITYNATAFPNGIKPLSDLAISKGFQWSMYTDEGVNACDVGPPRAPGSKGYEDQDAAIFAAWNTVYLKVDNCYVEAGQNAPKDPRTDFVSRYGAMRSALDKYGIKGMLVCEWGVPYSTSSGLQGPAQWTPQLATSYRVSDDIAQGWSNVMRITNEAINVGLRSLSGPGRFADMDLLEVGNAGMTSDEQASHFALWAMMKSALMISTSVPNMSQQTLSVLSNKGLIAINQDSLGAPVTLVQRFSNDYDLFAGPLANGDVAVLLVDQSNKARSLSVNFSSVNVSSATVTNLWTGAATNGASSYSGNVAAHGSLPLRLSSVKKASTVASKLNSYEAETATLSGGATVQSCSGCSGGKNVGYIGNGGSATINNIRTSQSSSAVRFDYLDCEIGYLSGGSNTRSASVSVNGGPAQTVVFPLSGYNWDLDVYKGFKVMLSGFNTGAANSVTISGAGSGYAPDLDRISIVA